MTHVHSGVRHRHVPSTATDWRDHEPCLCGQAANDPVHEVGRVLPELDELARLVTLLQVSVDADAQVIDRAALLGKVIAKAGLPPAGVDGRWGPEEAARAAGVSASAFRRWRNAQRKELQLLLQEGGAEALQALAYGERQLKLTVLPLPDGYFGRDPRWWPWSIIPWHMRTGRLTTDLRPTEPRDDHTLATVSELGKHWHIPEGDWRRANPCPICQRRPGDPVHQAEPVLPGLEELVPLAVELRMPAEELSNPELLGSAGLLDRILHRAGLPAPGPDGMWGPAELQRATRRGDNAYVKWRRKQREALNELRQEGGMEALQALAYGERQLHPEVLPLPDGYLGSVPRWWRWGFLRWARHTSRMSRLFVPKDLFTGGRPPNQPPEGAPAGAAEELVTT